MFSQLSDHIMSTCSKIFSLCGIFTGAWASLGMYNTQIATLCTIICTVVAVLSYIKGKKK